MDFFTKNAAGVVIPSALRAELTILCPSSPYMCVQKQRWFWGLSLERRAWGSKLQVGTGQGRE